MIDRDRLTSKFALIVNILDVLALIVILTLAFIFQWVFHELPCPLCLLQRVGFLITGIGFLLNLRYSLRPSHYAISLIGALFTSFVALRQIALHVVPGTGAYGSSILGLHMYTWSFIASMAIICFTAILLSFDAQYRVPEPELKRGKFLVSLLMVIMLALALSNVVVVLNECGLFQCPENPMPLAVP
jgi:disulfide bond formation protein DsbB